MSTIVVFGAAGQLGQCLAAVAHERGALALVFLTRREADLLDPASLRRVFAQYRPTYAINCAAYTAVDRAEDEPEAAHRLNCDGVENLARLCGEFGTVLVHVSTDFVFAGTGNQPLRETDPIAPLSVYGRTKLAGEQAIPAYTGRYFIVRTSWLYSEYGNNFVKTMLRLGAERPELRVVWDQVGTPCYGRDLAGALLEMIDSGSTAYGIYHYSNEGLTSWYDFATAICELAGRPTLTVPIRTAEYPTCAVRPAYSVLDKAKIKAEFSLAIPHWRESLQVCLGRLG